MSGSTSLRSGVLVIGGGPAGLYAAQLLREIDPILTLGYEVVGLVDDDPRKQGTRIHGVEVVGPVERLPDLCRARGAEEIVIAIPSAAAEQHRRILAWCRESRVPVKSVPALGELLRGKARIGQLQEVEPQDLLERQAVRFDLERLGEELEGRRVLVTGAGGAGAEPRRVCHQDRGGGG